MSTNYPAGSRGLYKGDDPHGFTLRDHKKNAAAVRIALNHEYRTGHRLTDLMDDTPDGDVVVGLVCTSCDWYREFPYKFKTRAKETA